MKARFHYSLVCNSFRYDNTRDSVFTFVFFFSSFQEYLLCSEQTVQRTCGDDAAVFTSKFLKQMASNIIKVCFYLTAQVCFEIVLIMTTSLSDSGYSRLTGRKYAKWPWWFIFIILQINSATKAVRDIFLSMCLNRIVVYSFILILSVRNPRCLSLIHTWPLRTKLPMKCFWSPG